MEHALFITKISDLKYWTKKYIRLYYGNEFCQTLLPTKEDISNIIDSNAAYRENIRWDLTTDYTTELDKIETWLSMRLIFIDDYINTKY